jgi:pimeloyl-ACP methyl ester carboxylesterase
MRTRLHPTLINNARGLAVLMDAVCPRLIGQTKNATFVVGGPGWHSMQAQHSGAACRRKVQAPPGAAAGCRVQSMPQRPPQQEIRFTRLASGARIAWARSGHGPPLLRAAHWMTHVERDADSPIWRPWLERLGRQVSLVSYDERGCGLSGADDTPLGLDAAVEELLAVADAAGLGQTAVLGISGSAAPAIAMAARHPERVTHLVLLGAYSHGLLHSAPSAEALAYHEATLRLVELGWGKADSAVQQFFTATLIPDATPAQKHALNEQQRLSCDGRRAAAILRARVALDVRPLLPWVRCPTLVLHAAADATVPVERGRELAAGIAGASFETLATRNHIPLAGEPAFERFCDALAAHVCPAQAPALTGLSPRDRALLDLVARGHDNLQIAAHLGLAEKTVRNTLSRLYTRLAVEGRPQAIVRARELGFG